MRFVIHPQDGSICASWKPSSVDPYDLVTVGPPVEDVVIWSVPRIREARLVDCRRCGKTGVQPKTWEAVVRYIPGAVLVESEGVVTVHLPTALAGRLDPPTGSGEDEESDGG